MDAAGRVTYAISDDLNPSTDLVPPGAPVTVANTTDGALTKLDADGNLAWSRSLGSVGGGLHAVQIAAEPTGGAWVLATDQRYGSPPNPTTFARPSLTRFSPGGDMLWQRTVGGEFDAIYPVGLTLEPNGQAVVAVHLNQGVLQIAGAQYGQNNIT